VEAAQLVFELELGKVVAQAQNLALECVLLGRFARFRLVGGRLLSPRHLGPGMRQARLGLGRSRLGEAMRVVAQPAPAQAFERGGVAVRHEGVPDA
jgi:hypothetical protein